MEKMGWLSVTEAVDVHASSWAMRVRRTDSVERAMRWAMRAAICVRPAPRRERYRRASRMILSVSAWSILVNWAAVPRRSLNCSSNQETGPSRKMIER